MLSKMLYICKNIKYIYPDGTIALTDISLNIPTGKITALIGPNGSGKTTLLLILAGLLKPSRGKVLFRGTEIDKYQNFRKEVSIVFQTPEDQLITSTVYDEIAFGPRQLGLNNNEIEDKIFRLAKKLDITHLLYKAPYQLSGGEKKRVAVASALSTDPSVLLFDEPFSELSYNNLLKIIETIKDFVRHGGSVIYTWHDTNMIMGLADYIIVMKQNGVTAGEPRDIIINEKLLAEVGLELPLIVKIYKTLTGKLDKKIPISYDDLIKFLYKKIYG
jgi:cobalt/nickel transport system ATP-binding protein